MSTLLRWSGSIARLSRTNINSHSSLRTPHPIYFSHVPHTGSQRLRQYATVNPQDPKDPKDKDNSSTNKKKVPDNPTTPSKPAPGFEKLYNNESPMSSTPTGETEAKEPPGTPLTEAEMKHVDNLMSTIKKGMPADQARLIDRAAADIKRMRIPTELREIIEARKKGKSLDIATAAKLVRILTKMARQSAEQDTNRQGNEGTDKSSTSTPPGADRKQGSQGSSGPSFEFKLDNQTLLLSAFVGYMVYRALAPSENSKNITWQEFRTTFFDKGLVEKLTVINKSQVRVDLHREATAQMYPESPAQYGNFHYYFSIGSVEAFERRLDVAQEELGIPQQDRIPVAYLDRASWIRVFWDFGPLIVLLALPWLIRRGSGAGVGGQSGLFGIGKSRAKRFNHETDIKVKFKDVAGMDEAKAEIMEFVSFLRDPGQYSRLGAKIPRGAILSGPPGTGKTLLAKATAGESGVPFFSVSGSEFVEMFVGVGPSRVRDLFTNARKNTPCIIFIDEIDAIGKKRGQGIYGGDSERESTLNQILTEMDGFNTSEQVVVLAGTNRPDVLDSALMRPGRFDRHINIDRPTMEGRKQIFNVHVGKIITDEPLEYLTGRLAALTPGFSGADIANCVNEAALTGTATFFPSFLEILLTLYKRLVQMLLKSSWLTSNQPSSALLAAWRTKPESSTRKRNEQ